MFLSRIVLVFKERKTFTNMKRSLITTPFALTYWYFNMKIMSNVMHPGLLNPELSWLGYLNKRCF